jgi:hypothetical protein
MLMFNQSGHNSIEFLIESWPQYLPKLMLTIFDSISLLEDVELIESQNSIKSKLNTTVV